MLECQYVLEIADGVRDADGVVNEVKLVVAGMEGMESVFVE